MKKTLTLLLTAVMLACAVFGTYGCTGTDAPTSTTQATAAPTEAPTENPDDIKEQNISYAKYTQYKLETDVPVKNIIIMVGDGMGLNHVKAAEMPKGRQACNGLYAVHRTGNDRFADGHNRQRRRSDRPCLWG